MNSASPGPPVPPSRSTHLLWVLRRWNAPRTGVSLAVLMLAGALVGALVLVQAGVVRAMGQQRPSAVSRSEATYAAHPHDIVVVGDTGTWHPIGAEETEPGAEFTVTYRGSNGLYLVLTSAPKTFFLGGGPDPLRWGCNDLEGVCAEAADGAYVVPLTGASAHGQGSLPMDRIRTEAAPDLFVEVALAREDPVAPEPETLVEQVDALGLRVAEPEDLTGIAWGVYEWNRPEPWLERWLEPWRD